MVLHKIGEIFIRKEKSRFNNILQIAGLNVLQKKKSNNNIIQKRALQKVSHSSRVTQQQGKKKQKRTHIRREEKRQFAELANVHNEVVVCRKKRGM